MVREAHHAQFLLELDGLELMIMKGQNLREVSNLDIENYRRTVDDIGENALSNFRCSCAISISFVSPHLVLTTSPTFSSPEIASAVQRHPESQ